MRFRCSWIMQIQQLDTCAFLTWHMFLNSALHKILLRSESPSGKCAKLRTVAASNNRVHMPRSLYHCLFALHIYIYCCSSRTSRSWWITQSTQRQRRGSNNAVRVSKEIQYLLQHTIIKQVLVHHKNDSFSFWWKR